MKISIVDNYDSFTYNLLQIFGSLGCDITVIRSDRPLRDVIATKPDRLVISPGPGRPENAGVSVEAIKHFAETIPVLGICLGHQAIGIAFGATVAYAKQLMHGKQSVVELSPLPLFKGLPDTITVGRYHSLAIERDSLPTDLYEIAATPFGQEQEVMGVKLNGKPVFGLQFHPESVLSSSIPDVYHGEGAAILANFLSA